MFTFRLSVYCAVRSDFSALNSIFGVVNNKKLNGGGLSLNNINSMFSSSGFTRCCRITHCTVSSQSNKQQQLH